MLWWNCYIVCSPLHLCQGFVRFLSGRRFPSKLLQKMEERKEREEGEENILWEWLYNICFSALRLGFKEEEYSGSEGPTNEPCRVVVHLQNTTTEAPLALQLIPQTIPEDVAANSSLLTSTLSASSKTMCLHLCHATDLYLTLCPRPLGRGRQPGIQAYACAGIPWNLGILWTINNCQLH